MKIERIEWFPRDLPRKERFATSRSSSDVAHAVFVRPDPDGRQGWVDCAALVFGAQGAEEKPPAAPPSGPTPTSI